MARITHDTKNFGIGTATPATKLHINGDTLIEGGNKLYFRATNSPWLSSDALGNSLLFGEVSTEWGRCQLGDWGFGSNNPSARVHIKSSGNTSATYAQKIENSSTTNLLSIRDDGLATFGGNISVGNGASITSSGAYFGLGPALSIWATTLSVGQDLTTDFTYNYLPKASDAQTHNIQIKGQNAKTNAINYLIGGKILINGGDGASLSAGLASGGNVEIDGGTGYGTGAKGLVKIQGLTYPSVDGTGGQAIITNGSGILSWGAPSSAEWSRTGTVLSPRTAGDTVTIGADGKAILIGSTGVSPNRYIQFRNEDATSVRCGMIPDNSGAFWIDGGTDKSFGFRSNNGGTFGANASTPAFYIAALASSNVSINAGISPSAKLHIKGNGNTSATDALLVQSSTPINLFKVRDDGYCFFGSSGTASLYGSSAGGLYITSNAANPIYLGESGDANNRIGVLSNSITTPRVGNSPFTIQGYNLDYDAPSKQLIIKGGDAYVSAATNKNGGDVLINGGTPAAGGTKGLVKLQGLTYPSADGVTGQFIKTDGAGNLSFSNVSTVFAIQTVSTNTVLTSANYTTLVDATSGAISITLPAVSNSGLVLNIKKIDSSANNVTITPAGAETIDGSASKTISSQWTNVTIQSDGTNWYIL